MKAYTDYPFESLGDTAGIEAPIRECVVVDYDGDKYCEIMIENQFLQVKSGYLYTSHGRLGEVPNIPQKKLSSI